MRTRSNAAVLFGLTMFLSPLCAQTYKATVTGIVTDPTGAVLPGVTMVAKHQETNVERSVLTNDDGTYTLVELSPGTYELRAELPGFKTYLQSNITLQVEQVARIDIAMTIGELAQSVEVVGEAPLINSETSSKGEVITHEEITDLPLLGRDFADLAYLTAGVTPREEGGQGAFGNINGARADGINFVVDSGSNVNVRAGGAQVRPAIDSIQEFRVQTSNYSTEYGRMSSGIINVALRSGTNRFHGSLYDFHRNHAFNARNFFDQGKSKFIRHLFGGNAGGPIRQDKAFFFISYEMMREREGIPRLGRVPTQRQRDGDFSDFPIQLIHPVTKKPFPNNSIPKSEFHPASVKVMPFYPLPNLAIPFGSNNYYSNKSDNDEFNDLVAKVDYHLFKGDNLSVRYLLNNRFLISPFAGSILPGFGDEADTRQHMWGLNYTRMFRPNVVNQTILAFSRTSNFEYSINSKVDYAGKFGIPGTTKDPKHLGFPQIQVRGYSAIGDANTVPIDFTVNNYQFNNITTLVQGRHNLRFGAEIVRTQFFQLFADNARGVFSFQGRWTSASALAREQEPFADFLLGFLQSANRRVSFTKSYLFSSSYGFYFQDDWKVKRNLTVNLGVRYELILPPTDKFGRWSHFVPEVNRIVISGDKGFPRSLVYADKNNIAPRIGLAWRARGNKKTVIRAGWGLFYNTNIQNPIRSNLATNPPFTIRENFSRQVSNPLLLTFSSPFPDRRLVIDQITQPNGFQINPATSNLYQYNLTFEQQLSKNIAVELAYVGSKGTHLGRRLNINQPVRSAETAPTFPRPFPQYATIDYFAFDADSNYNALQMTLRKRSAGGLNFRLNYTYAKSIDDSSRLSGTSAAGFGGVQDFWNRDAERGRSDFDRRHAFVTSVLYRLPIGRGGKAAAGIPGWLNLFVGGWQVSSIVRIYGGTPITPQVSAFDVNRGEPRRPDRIGSGKLEDRSPHMWFNIRDFVPVPLNEYRFGNSGRNILTGPNYHYYDFSLMKQFTLPNEHQLELRWEIYNVPNHTNFNLPQEMIDVPAAGVITSAQAPRRMQVALKYNF